MSEAKPKRPYRKATPEVQAFRDKVRQSRVDYVAEMMRELTYQAGTTTEALTKEWDLPRNQCLSIVYEARDIVRDEANGHGKDHVRAKVYIALDRLISEAIAKGDIHAAVKVIALWAQITGAGEAAKHQIQHEVSGLTAEQLKARKDEILARLAGQK